MSSINDFDFNGKRVLVRVDFNVPLNENLEVTDETRIDAALPTIKHILSGGGSIILMSHLGRPKGERNEKYSLKAIVPSLERKLGTSVILGEDCIGQQVIDKANQLSPGQVLLLENLRFHSEETAGDEAFAKQLAELGDVYVNDAFGTAHRAHASTSIIAQFFPNARLFGLLMEREVTSIKNVLHSPEHPITAIIGGAKVSSKLPVIVSLLDKVDSLLIGGGMAYTFIKAQGGQVGNSLVEDDMLEDALNVLRSAKEKGVKFVLPTDTKIADAFSNEANSDECAIGSIPEGWLGVDLGAEAVADFKTILNDSKTILWNGPVGVFEMPKFAEGTRSVAQFVAEATTNGAYSLVGGGDSVAAVSQMGISDSISYISTGGGALLEMLEGKDLPGVVAIEQ